jgi:hypothetical protein
MLMYGFKIILEISSFRPYSSISFPDTEEIQLSLQEISRVVDRNMAKNKHKMETTVIHILEDVAENNPGDPVGLNLTKSEQKSFQAAAKLIKRILKGEKSGENSLTPRVAIKNRHHHKYQLVMPCSLERTAAMNLRPVQQQISFPSKKTKKGFLFPQ